MLGLTGSLRIEAAEETDQVQFLFYHFHNCHQFFHHHHFCLLHGDQYITIGCLESNTNTKYKLIIDPQGKYECVATNTVGTEYSYSAQLYVRGLCHHYSSFLNMNHQKRIRYTEHSFCQNTF